MHLNCFSYSSKGLFFVISWNNGVKRYKMIQKINNEWQMKLYYF